MTSRGRGFRFHCFKSLRRVSIKISELQVVGREEMASREEKVMRIFQKFDMNKDGGLNREEMTSMVIAVNPKVMFTQEQINAILDEVFRVYGDEMIIDGEKGITFEGLLKTYNDGAGDVDRDFITLELDDFISMVSGEIPLSSSSVESSPPPKKNDMVFDETQKIVQDLEFLMINYLGSKDDQRDNKSSPRLSQKLSWDELGHNYATFVKELEVLKGKADGKGTREESFNVHMAIGKVLYEHCMYKEGLVSFKRAKELQPTDFRPNFRAGNCLYALGRYEEAKEEFLLALEVIAEADGNQWSYLLPQIHVNLGISLEAEGMVLNACEHYKEASTLCPTHFRALKLLGSALLGVGDYPGAEKALEQAIFLKSDYVDAYCDLGSVLHAAGEDERAIQAFQKAIDLKPGHVDALYNLGNLYMDMGRYQRASEMYTRVLAVSPNHWQARVNKAVALLGVGEAEEARKSLEEASKMTNRVELYDAVVRLRQMEKKKPKVDEEEAFLVVELPKFKRGDLRTTLRQDMASALEIRAFQKLTRLHHCDIELLKKEMNETDVSLSYSSFGIPEISIRKDAIERILRRLLHFLKPETFQGAVQTINKWILSVMDPRGSGKVDLGMFYAVLAPICSGPSEKRKQMIFDALLWRPANENGGLIRIVDVYEYFKLLRAIYIPSPSVNEIKDVQGEADVSYAKFLEMFDDPDWGFWIMDTLVKLETGDSTHHGNHTCSVCQYPIMGSCFKEMKSHFSLCSQCYSEGKVPRSFIQDEYIFKEYDSEAEAIIDKCSYLSMYCKNLSRNNR